MAPVMAVRGQVALVLVAPVQMAPAIVVRGQVALVLVAPVHMALVQVALVQMALAVAVRGQVAPVLSALTQVTPAARGQVGRCRPSATARGWPSAPAAGPGRVGPKQNARTKLCLTLVVEFPLPRWSPGGQPLHPNGHRV